MARTITVEGIDGPAGALTAEFRVLTRRELMDIARAGGDFLAATWVQGTRDGEPVELEDIYEDEDLVLTKARRDFLIASVRGPAT